MKGIHGGDVYRNHVKIDFSVSVNPLGIPREVEDAIRGAVSDCGKYPDISAERLREAVGAMLGVPERYLLFGNGASELFMAVVHALRSKKTVIPVPSFYGYEYAAEAADGDGEIIYYETKKEDCFCLREDFMSVLTEDVDILFIANPNNPTGNLTDGEFLRKLLCHCRDVGICVVLDECFVEFCGGGHSMVSEMEMFPNLLIVRAFTKIFSIPGVRLGYLICADSGLCGKIGRHLPEWNISSFAQAAGCECAKQTAFVGRTVEFIRTERLFLEEGLKRAGFEVFGGAANFLLIYSEIPLYDMLLEEGILIRDCENFRGLSRGFYRIAVRGREENEILLKTIEEIKWKK